MPPTSNRTNWTPVYVCTGHKTLCYFRQVYAEITTAKNDLSSVNHQKWKDISAVDLKKFEEKVNEVQTLCMKATQDGGTCKAKLKTGIEGS